MTSAAPIDATARRRLASVAREHRLDLVLLFGSRARGVTHAESDVDIAVCRPEGTLSFDEILDLGAALGAAIGYDVDLVDLRAADPLLLHQIFLRTVVLHGEPGALERERLRAFHRYEDYRPFLRLERDAVRRQVRRHAGKP